MISIVCGGRDYSDAARVKQILDAAVAKLGLHTIIEGDATGADRLARKWATNRGDISVITVQPGTNWPAAGPIRNSKMLRILTAGPEANMAVIGFPGGRGTENMIGQCVDYNRELGRDAIRIIRA